MEIFVRNVPVEATAKQVRDYFHQPFAAVGIGEDYHAEKMRDKHLAVITILNRQKAQHFLDLHGVPQNASRHVIPTRPLRWLGKTIMCCVSREPMNHFSVQSLVHESSQRRQQTSSTVTTTQPGTQNSRITRFGISSVSCGLWDYNQSRLMFVQHWSEARAGTISLGLKAAVVILGDSTSRHSRIDLEYQHCNNVVVSASYADPVVTFSLRCAPRFFQIKAIGDDDLVSALMMLRLDSSMKKSKERLPNLNSDHAKIAGTCFVYRITLAHYSGLNAVNSLLGNNAKAPPRVSMTTQAFSPSETLHHSFARLNHDLTDAHRYGELPWNVRFQVDRLARNGVLPPLRVRELLPNIQRLSQDYGVDAALSALSRFYRDVRFAGPDTESHELSFLTLTDMLDDFAASYDQYKQSPESPYELVKRHQHINLIHKIVVTPATTRLEGPEPEPTNRVLRRYPNHSSHFLRVVFEDEDGGSVRYDSRASNTPIYQERFKAILDGNVLIAGQAFSFLGFSHSSLRNQSCWFMAPMYIDRTLLLPEHIIQSLGEFGMIRVPAKCAARIGQNFTDTNATIDIHNNSLYTMACVTRNGHDFSDGVGTISRDLLRRVWGVYGTRRALKPTALQIRFQGYKGMVSLDRRLLGEKLVLRSNMKKFDTSAGSWNLEICGAAFKPLPLILNRQLIKILEDLGVQETVFHGLQKKAMDRLRYVTTTNAVNAASFLEEQDSPKSTRMPTLIKLLNQIGLEYRQDGFIFRVVEMAVVNTLRDIKYRARIPVSAGHTLYGIMDESGYLKEGEVYIVTENPPEGGRRVLVQEGIAVTRSPALHPGDVQIVNAVDVPANSLLHSLSNVIVFSQHGHRDLPSQLSGGDLDGDQFHIICHPGLIPRMTVQAAEYPRLQAAELDRAVTRKDMSDFFVTFMESDLLGMICNIHLQLADQREHGTFDEACIKLAQMASTAVDFSKTGIPVNMKECPRHDRNRPDFMAPSPRVMVSGEGHLDLEDEDRQDDPAFEDLDAERKPIRYYQSQKVLGQLYRAIDEQQFLAKMHSDRHAILGSGSCDIMGKLLQYMKRIAARYGVLYVHHAELARDIRAGYEERLAEILYSYAPTPNQPISEHEAFAGTILGRKGGPQNKPLRELGKTMRERFQTIVEYNVMRIVKGDEQMNGASDLDMLYDDGGLDREVEALPRAIACLQVAIEEKGPVDRRLGELQSFKYIAAGVCLREFERYSITTLGSYALPPI